MGAESSSPEALRHPRLGLVRRQSVKPGQSLIVLSRTVKDEQALQQWENGLRLARSFKNWDLLLPVSYSPKRGGICHTSIRVELKLQYHPKTLKGDILERAVSANYYSLQTLNYILYTLARACKDFEEAGTEIGHVHPENILLGEDENIHILTKHSLPNQENSQFGEADFPSPQSLQQSKAGERLLQNTQGHSFAVGMTVLEAATLQSSADLYDFEGCTVSEDTIKQRLAEMQTENGLFVKIVSDLLRREAEGRPSCSEVFALLQAYQPQILERQPFVFSSSASAASFKRYLSKKGLESNF